MKSIDERPLPRFPFSHAALIVVSFIAFGALGSWLTMRYGGDVWLVVLFFTPAVIAYFYYHRRRCPHCHRRLNVRRDYIHGTQCFRLLLDCPRCQIAWDTGEIGDEES